MADGGSVTKARLLTQAGGLLNSARVLPLAILTVAEWTRDADDVARRIFSQPWSSGPLAVRSSALDEDRVGQSAAGRYTSVLGVSGREELIRAIDRVVLSYGEPLLPEHEVFVQPMLEGALAIGAATTADPSSSGRYRVITWSEDPNSGVVTSGQPGRLHHWRGIAGGRQGHSNPIVARVLACVEEIEQRLGFEFFEIEFGIDPAGALVLFQLRQVEAGKRVSPGDFSRAVERAALQVGGVSQRDERILGNGMLLGAMSDWNPAEIIGLRPLPLARSLYRRIVTDTNWADRRAAYGYRDLRGVPLMVDVAGHALIDLRASFTSLIPAGIADDVATRLANSYCEHVRRNPALHDKVEFEVAVTCTSFSSAERLARMLEYGLGEDDIGCIQQALRNLTEAIVGGGLVSQELAVVEQLARHRTEIAGLPHLDKALRLIDAASEWGGAAFGGLARCSFVATDILRSAVDSGVVAKADVDRFFAGMSLPSTALRTDLADLPRETFLHRYGHLRPGTYDIRMPCYSEAPDYYFPGAGGKPAPDPGPQGSGKASEEFLAAFDAGFRSLDMKLEAPAFVAFARAAIEAREWSKFEFSHSLSNALSAIVAWGESMEIGRDDLALLEIEDLSQAGALGPADVRSFLRCRISDAKKTMSDEHAVALPILLRSADEVGSYFSIVNMPNFVTQHRAVAPTADISRGDNPSGAIALIPHGDPGYDWIFSRGIAGLITAFGGPNSHMAVRALEAGIPALIGCGPSEYARLAKFNIIELDAGTRMARGVA